MPKTVEQIRQQIAKLKEQEKALLDREVAGVVARIREAIAHYGLTVEQVFGGGAAASRRPPQARKRSTAGQKPGAKQRRGESAKPVVVVDARHEPAARAPSTAKGTKIPAKYSDGAGNAWSGRGSQPRWLRAALASGKKLDDFLIA